MENKWKPYSQLDLAFNLTRIDTRDFHGYNDDCSDKEITEIFSKVKKKYRDDNSDTCFTRHEIEHYLDKMFIESGGKVGWRFLSFLGDKRSGSWIFKYINIYKLKEDCYIIEGKQNNDAILLSKSVIEKGINKEHLSAH
jgi:hypothetical protein